MNRAKLSLAIRSYMMCCAESNISGMNQDRHICRGIYRAKSTQSGLVGHEKQVHKLFTPGGALTPQFTNRGLKSLF